MTDRRRGSAKRSDRDFAEEIRSHLEIEEEQLIGEGASARDAQALARRAFGNVTHAQEFFHESRRVRWLEEVARDVGYALRQLRRAPMISTAVILTLALGVGANALVYGVVDRLLFREPPAIKEPKLLRRLYFSGLSPVGPMGTAMYSTPVTPFAVVTAMRHAPAFAAVAGFDHLAFTLGRGANARRIDGEDVTGNYFEMLGVRPALGRLFTPEDVRPPVAQPAVVLSYAFWMRQFGGARDVIGMSLRIVRLAPAATDRSAASEATVLYKRLVRDWRAKGFENAPDTIASVIPVSIIAGRTPDAPPEARVSLWLGGVASIVLLIACANVANLLLARAFRRRREIAVRLALGVDRARLIRQLLTETLLLAMLASTAAIVVALVGEKLIGAFLLPRGALGPGLIDGRITVVAIFLALAATLMAGVAPAVLATRLDIAGWLATGARDSGRRSPLQIGLLIAQASLSAVLLIGAGLFVRSLQRVRATEVGVDLAHVLLVQSSYEFSDLDSATGSPYGNGRNAASATRAWRNACDSRHVQLTEGWSHSDEPPDCRSPFAPGARYYHTLRHCH